MCSPRSATRSAQAPAFAEGLGCERWDGASGGSAIRPSSAASSPRALRGDEYLLPPRQLVQPEQRRDPTGKILRVGAPARRGSTDPSCATRRRPLACEIRLTRPAYAVILFGTNDVALALGARHSTRLGYFANMTRIVSTAEARGVVPDPEHDSAVAQRPAAGPRIDELNAARSTGSPPPGAFRLMNLWRALEPAAESGCRADGVHLSVYRGPRVHRTLQSQHVRARLPAGEPHRRPGSAHGYNVRNLITLLALSRLSQRRACGSQFAERPK